VAHVEKRGPRRWVAIYTNPAAPSRRGARSFERKVDAERFLAVTQSAQLRNEWVDPKAGRVTVREYGVTWLASRSIRPSTRERYTGYLTYINRLGDFPLSALSRSIMETWQAGIVADMADTSAYTIRGVFAAMLQCAVRDRLLVESPLADVRGVKVARQLVRPLPLDVVMSIRDTITPRYRAAVVTGAGTGLRRGEAMGLTVDRVDWLRRVVTVDRQLVGVVEGRPLFGPPKTPASVRQIPVSPVVLDALAAHLATWPAEDDGLIFRAPRGGPVSRSKFGASWRAASGSPPGSRFHDLRHYYASALIQGGANVLEVQARLGHKSATETLDTYAHLWPNSEDNTRRIIDAALSETRDAAKSHLASD
jgi:integrase